MSPTKMSRGLILWGTMIAHGFYSKCNWNTPIIVGMFTSLVQEYSFYTFSIVIDLILSCSIYVLILSKEDVFGGVFTAYMGSV